MLFGTRVAETILASVHVRAHQQTGHMDASDLIKALQNILRGGGRPHMGQGQVVGAGVLDGGGDGGIGRDGVDGDERVAQPVVLDEPGQEHRDGGDLAGLVWHGFLAKHQAAGGGERRDEVGAEGPSKAAPFRDEGLACRSRGSPPRDFWPACCQARSAFLGRWRSKCRIRRTHAV